MDTAAVKPARRTVWLVNQYAMTPDLPGISRPHELSGILARHGWDSIVYATGFHHYTHKYLRPVRPWRPKLWETNQGVRFCWLYSTPYQGNGLTRYINTVSFLATVALATMFDRRPDVVIGSSPHLLTGLAGWIAARRHRAPFIFEVGDMWPDMLVQLGLTNPLVTKPLYWLEKFLYTNADRVVALSEGVGQRIIAKGVPANKVVVVPNSVPAAPELDEARRQVRRQELGWEGKTVVAWAGAHNLMNGLDVVVEAARLLQDDPSILVVFVGDGAKKQELIEQARGLPNVRFYDSLPKSEIGDFLRAADMALVHSRQFEVFTGTRPNKIFEYMSAGLPLVTTVPGEAWSLVEEAEAGVYAEWENPPALAEAIRALAQDPEQQREMGRNAHRYARQAHDLTSNVARFASVLDDLAPLSAEPKDQAGAANRPPRSIGGTAAVVAVAIAVITAVAVAVSSNKR